MFDNVVVGASLADATLDALALAKTLAPSAGTLTLVHVQAHGEARDGNGTDLVRDSPLPEPLLTLPGAVNGGGTSFVVVGAPSAGMGLQDYARRAGADLIVVGSSSRDRVERTLRRDTKHAVLENPPCAAAVAPTGYAGRGSGLRRIGVGYDGSLASQEAVGVARTLAAERNAKLSALEAVPPVVFAREPWSDDYQVENRVSAALERVEALDVAEGHAQYGSPDSELARFGASVDLLVLGPHEPEDTPHHGGTLSQRVAEHAPCALLVLALPAHGA